MAKNFSFYIQNTVKIKQNVYIYTCYKYYFPFPFPVSTQFSLLLFCLFPPFFFRSDILRGFLSLPQSILVYIIIHNMNFSFVHKFPIFCFVSLLPSPVLIYRRFRAFDFILRGAKENGPKKLRYTHNNHFKMSSPPLPFVSLRGNFEKRKTKDV